MTTEEMVREIYDRGAVKNIQRISVNLTATDAAIVDRDLTISPVNTNKSIIRPTFERKSLTAANTASSRN